MVSDVSVVAEISILSASESFLDLRSDLVTVVSKTKHKEASVQKSGKEKADTGRTIVEKTTVEPDLAALKPNEITIKVERPGVVPQDKKADRSFAVFSVRGALRKPAFRLHADHLIKVEKHVDRAEVGTKHPNTDIPAGSIDSRADVVDPGVITRHFEEDIFVVIGYSEDHEKSEAFESKEGICVHNSTQGNKSVIEKVYVSDVFTMVSTEGLTAVSIQTTGVICASLDSRINFDAASKVSDKIIAHAEETTKGTPEEVQFDNSRTANSRINNATSSVDEHTKLEGQATQNRTVFSHKKHNKFAATYNRVDVLYRESTNKRNIEHHSHIPHFDEVGKGLKDYKHSTNNHGKEITPGGEASLTAPSDNSLEGSQKTKVDITVSQESASNISKENGTQLKHTTLIGREALLGVFRDLTIVQIHIAVEKGLESHKKTTGQIPRSYQT